MPRRHVLTAQEEQLATDAASRTPPIQSPPPWRFAFADDRLEVWGQEGPTKGDDPSGRVRSISCGAATYDATLAIRAAGHEAWVQVQPSPAVADLAAVVHIGVRRPPAPEDLTLYDAIRERPIDPGPYRDWRLPFSLITRLEDAAEAEGGYFRVLTSTELERVRQLVAKAGGDVSAGGEVQAAGAASAGETARSGRDHLIPAQPGTRLAELGAEQQLTLAVLTTPGNSRTDWVRAGMALEHVLLTALLYGVVGVFLDSAAEPLCERARVHGTPMGVDHPQIVLRLGYPRHDIARAPRRTTAQAAATGRPGR
ncbi:hypothetical protein ABN028_16545 [Actinopolymorpha sp. B17G11]|uniref:hypothetical protein n=1 Tax=unclassified Actinopolymorpha TaxID=2627063 RepID=UPI0032D97F1C